MHLRICKLAVLILCFPTVKVAEVLLFSDDGVPGAGTSGLRMAFCQWPNDPTKVVVYGCNASDAGINAAAMDPSGAPFSSPSSNSGKRDTM